jgi:hypothetical protein
MDGFQSVRPEDRAAQNISISIPLFLVSGNSGFQGSFVYLFIDFSPSRDLAVQEILILSRCSGLNPS